MCSISSCARLPDGVYLTAVKQTEREGTVEGHRAVEHARCFLHAQPRLVGMADGSIARHSGDQRLRRGWFGVHAQRYAGESAGVLQIRMKRSGGRPMSNVIDQIRELDPNDPGRWPLPFRFGAIGLIFLIADGGARLFPRLEAEEAGARCGSRRRADAADDTRAKGSQSGELGRLQGAACGNGAVVRRDAAASCRTRRKCRIC